MNLIGRLLCCRPGYLHTSLFRGFLKDSSFLLLFSKCKMSIFKLIVWFSCIKWLVYFERSFNFVSKLLPVFFFSEAYVG